MNKSGITTGTTGFIIFLLLPHYQLPYLELFSSIDLLYDILRVVSALTILTIIVFDVVKNDRVRGQHLRLLVLLCLYYLEIIFSTVYNNVPIKDIILRIVSQLSVFLICNFYAAYFHRQLIEALIIISELLVYANLVLVLFNKDGLYRTSLYWNNWLFGYKNNFFQFFIGFIVASFLYKRYFKKTFRIVILNIAMLLSVIIVGSTTASMAMLLFYFLVLVATVDNGRIVNALNLSITNIILFFAVVVIRTIDIFNVIYDKFLGKSFAVMMRYRLWGRTWSLIMQKPWQGYGYRSNGATTLLLGARWATHAHNIVLQVLLEGGVVSLILYILFNYYLLKEIQRYKQVYVAQIIAIGMFVLYVSSLFEVYYKASTFVILGLASSVGAMAEIDKEIGNDYRDKIRIVLGISL